MKAFQFSLIAVLAISLIATMTVRLTGSAAMAAPAASDATFTIDVFAFGLHGPTGVVFDDEGNLYVANEGVPESDTVPGLGTYPGTTISKIAPDGEMSTFATGFEGPAGLAFDSQGNLYVSDDTDRVLSVTPDGDVTVFAYGLGNLNAICFDENWNLFAADHGSGTIYKITPEGDVIVFATGFNGPQALAFDDEGNLYTTDHTSRVFKLTSGGDTSILATFPGGTQGGLILDVFGNIYVSSLDLNVYKISAEGEVTPFISGFISNPWPSNFPRGLTFDKLGSMYIAEYGTGLIWKASITLVEVDIDIKPGSFPNSIALKHKGVIPVAILTTDDFDATAVDPDTVLFASASPVHYALEDVDDDGDIDMILHFKTQEVDIEPGDTEATLTGMTYDGKDLFGTDSVRTIPKGP